MVFGAAALHAELSATLKAWEETHAPVVARQLEHLAQKFLDGREASGRRG